MYWTVLGAWDVGYCARTDASSKLHVGLATKILAGKKEFTWPVQCVLPEDSLVARVLVPNF